MKTNVIVAPVINNVKNHMRRLASNGTQKAIGQCNRAQHLGGGRYGAKHALQMTEVYDRASGEEPKEKFRTAN